MGSQFGLDPEPFAWHKWKLGWLDADEQHENDSRCAVQGEGHE